MLLHSSLKSWKSTCEVLARQLLHLRGRSSYVVSRQSSHLAAPSRKADPASFVGDQFCNKVGTSEKTLSSFFSLIAKRSVRAFGDEKLRSLHQLYRDFGRQQDALSRQLQQYESRCLRSTRAIANAVSCSLYGQSLISIGIPLLAASFLSTPTASCYNGSVQQSNAPSFQQIRHSPAQPVKIFVDWVEAFKEEVYTCLRGIYLTALFFPVLAAVPVCVGLGWGWSYWVDMVQWTLTMAGPAFIKWGQWAATRPDLFPPDICEALSKLHSAAPSHSYAFTRYTIEHAFKRNMDDIFSDFEETPVASGSIAQVHRGVLNDGGAFGSKYKAGTVVAVKVRHPGVTTLMQRDFTLMRRAAVLCASLPFLRDLRLEESVRQFGAPLKEQLDLSSEARALAKFNRNFRTWRHVSFPAPVYPLVASDVLVETFEPGRLISRHVESPTNRHNLALANLGLQSYLKMLLKDNFIHADLHPGNILVRVTDPNSLWGRVTTYFGLNTAPKLILLDVGMTAEFTPADSEHLAAFFKAITTQDGKGLAENILSFSENQTCKDPDAFIQDMTELFESLDLNDISEHTSEIMQSMMEQIRKYQVDLKGIVSTVVVTTLVLEGWSTKLNPDIKILEALKALLPMPFVERLSISVDTLMSRNYGTTV